MMFYYHINLSWYIFFVPVIVFVQILFTLGIAFFGAAIIVFFRDVRYIVPLGLQLWMFATPVVYPVEVVPDKYLLIYLLNPMSGIIDSYRHVILYAKPPDYRGLLIASIIAVVSFLFAYRFFKKMEMKFADVI